MTATLPSMTNLQPNPDWASLPLFDRTGWKRMAFGAFAESIGGRAEPKDAPEEIYVGLEHLDPQCLHIRRWGKGSDVTGTKVRFRKGDIIFGRRRAYQRRLAVAESDGICSARRWLSLFGDDESRAIRFKDVDCALEPFHAAVVAGQCIARQLFDAGWQRRMQGDHQTRVPATTEMPFCGAD